MQKKLKLLIAISFLLSAPVYAEGLLMYKPPRADAPETRTGGGTRGMQQNMPLVQVLAPSQTALTASAQPVLYWYLAEASENAVEISVTKEGEELPLLERQFPSVAKPGLQSIELASYGARLNAGDEYRWSVALIGDLNQRSGDMVSSATIRYQPSETPLDIGQMAQMGYWYDALHKLVGSHSAQVNDLLQQIDIQIPVIAQ